MWKHDKSTIRAVETPDGYKLIQTPDGVYVYRDNKGSREITGLMRRVMRKKLTSVQLETANFERIEEGKEPKDLSILPKPKVISKV